MRFGWAGSRRRRGVRLVKFLVKVLIRGPIQFRVKFRRNGEFVDLGGACVDRILGE